jgi:hypothetical protein
MKTMAKGVTTMGRLADKNILITGGNSGIGLAATVHYLPRPFRDPRYLP